MFYQYYLSLSLSPIIGLVPAMGLMVVYSSPACMRAANNIYLINQQQAEICDIKEKMNS